mmetsp:Transcript_5305/g.10989  ORF Transcript_5305/g.10989 Transcript_5305/m.10989 type:complete len:281 (+) Transcript_5305:158-1000(+)
MAVAVVVIVIRTGRLPTRRRGQRRGCQPSKRKRHGLRPPRQRHAIVFHHLHRSRHPRRTHRQIQRYRFCIATHPSMSTPFLLFLLRERWTVHPHPSRNQRRGNHSALLLVVEPALPSRDIPPSPPGNRRRRPPFPIFASFLSRGGASLADSRRERRTRTRTRTRRRTKRRPPLPDAGDGTMPAVEVPRRRERAGTGIASEGGVSTSSSSSGGRRGGGNDAVSTETTSVRKEFCQATTTTTTAGGGRRWRGRGRGRNRGRERNPRVWKGVRLERLVPRVRS